MTTRILLIRHGETKWNLEGRYQGQIDTELSERGYEQARKLGLALKDVKIDAAYATPLSRAKETAREVAEHHGLEVQISPGLTEIAHGEWEGLLSSEVKEKYGVMVDQWHSTPHEVDMPGGENLRQIQERSMAALADIAAKHPGETVLVVAHDATNKVLVCGILGIDLKNFWQIKQDNTCINVLEYENNNWRACLLNDTCHMGEIFTSIEQKAL